MPQNRTPTTHTVLASLDRREALCLLLFVPVLLFAQPFQFGEKGSGRYLLGVLQALDPELFPNDAVAASIAHFGSLFYEVIGPAFAGLGVTPETLEPAFTALYCLSRLGLWAALIGLARSLDRGPEMPILCLMWAATVHTTYVGGTAYFVPALTHQQVAWILGLFALGGLMRQPPPMPRAWILGGLLGLALLIHPLISGYLVLTIGPAVWILRRSFWPQQALQVPLVLIGLCSLIYLVALSPPSFTDEEATIFVAYKATSEHVSLMHQPEFAWLKVILLLALAGASVGTLSVQEKSARLLLLAAFSGSVLAVLLSWIATTTEWSWLIRFQPLRMFSWIQLFAQLTILQAAVIAWRRSHALWPVLGAAVAFLWIDSIWFLAWTALACVALLAEGFATLTPSRRYFWIRLAASGLLGLIVLFFALGDRQPLASARDVSGVWIALVVAWMSVDTAPQRRRWQAAGLLILLLGLSVWQAQKATEPPDGPAWTQTAQWIRQHTAKTDRFLTAHGLPNFRFATWRTSDTEALSALYWVDPESLLPALENARRFAACYENGTPNTDCFFDLAREFDTAYVLLEHPLDGDIRPVFEDAPYRVYRVPGERP